MGWLGYTLITVACWAGWSFLGKLALDHTTSVQASLVFGVVSALVAVIAIGLGLKTTTWSAGALWIAVVGAICGGTGLITFYLALERGNASAVVPMIGIYPAIVALLSVAFLGERLSALQYFGVLLAVTGVMLIGAG
jgi:bacterial/archaeal transporter family protein